MDLSAAVRWLESHIDHDSWAARSGRIGTVDLSLDRMRRFVSWIGDPHEVTPVVHVTGTNGKGSTSRMITRLLMAEGLRVGTYSSPHLAAYNERFRIDDVDVDDATLTSLLTRMAAAEDRLGERLMPFEILTGAAFTLFAENDLDVAVVEVGVLGRFDATNVADGRVAVITNIGFDHTDGDGDWRRRIATEKAGIIKPGAHLVLGHVEPRFDETFRAEHPAAVWKLGHEIVVDDDVPVSNGRRCSITTPWQHVEAVELPLHGSHQTTNAALALTAASAFVGRALHEGGVRSGFASVSMPARFEVLRPSTGGPTIVLDGAHNPDAAATLSLALDELACAGRRTLIIGLLAGRDPVAMLEAVGAAEFDEVVVSTPPTARARPAAELADAARTLGVNAQVVEDVADALAGVMSSAGPDDQIIVTGSIYLVADARDRLFRQLD